MKYKKVASYIRNKILLGDWIYGMRIPSQRELAQRFNVNRVTIIKSIELLEQEGFIITRTGSGTYVSNYLKNQLISNKWMEMMEWSSIGRNQYTVQLINKLETNTSYLHISKGELGTDLIPHLELKNAMNRVSNDIGTFSLGYNNGYGYHKLRELIACRLKKSGIQVSKENVLITSGALHAIQLINHGFLSQNTTIFSNTPSYIDSTQTFKHLNMRKVTIPHQKGLAFTSVLDKYLSLKEKALYLDPTFNNPTGASMSLNHRQNIIDYCLTHNIPIIEDDIYRDIWFDREPDPSLKSLDKNGSVIYISSYSKTVAPALRIGWIIASEKVIEQLADIRMQIDYGSSMLSQMVIYELLKSGDYERHIQRIRKILKKKRDFTLDILEKHFQNIAHWEVPKGGFFIWLTLKDNINVKKIFSELIEKEHILINPGHIYNSDENTIRLSFAYETNPNIELGLKKLHEYIVNYVDN